MVVRAVGPYSRVFMFIQEIYFETLRCVLWEWLLNSSNIPRIFCEVCAFETSKIDAIPSPDTPPFLAEGGLGCPARS